MIWATVSSQSCFCLLYRASPSFTAKNIINLISVLNIWWYPCVESSLVLLEEGVCYNQCVPLARWSAVDKKNFPYVEWRGLSMFRSDLLFWGLAFPCVCVAHLGSQLCLTATPWTVACLAPVSMGFPGKNTGVGCLSSSRGSSQPRDWSDISCFFCIGRLILYHWAT